MSYLRSAIFSTSNSVQSEGLTLVDIGARGDIPPPWNKLETLYPDRLKVIGFEPDKSEHSDLMKKFPNREYINKALGAESGTKKFYLNKIASTSSNYLANFELLKSFHPNHSRGRDVVRILDVPVTTLDSVMSKNLSAPFIKIDVQGAELDIMKGGRLFFEKVAAGFSAECWTYPIYEGQPLLHEILSWANTNNFELYSMQEVGRWDLSSKLRNKSKGIPVCFDVLFFNKFASYSDNMRSVHDIRTFALLLDLWGFPDAAVELLDHYCGKKSKVEDLIKLISKQRKRRSFKNQILNEFTDRVKVKFGLVPNFPPIHD